MKMKYVILAFLTMVISASVWATGSGGSGEVGDTAGSSATCACDTGCNSSTGGDPSGSGVGSGAGSGAGGTGL